MASPSGTPAPRVLEREARRLLPLLDAPGAVARVVPARRAGAEREVAVFVGSARSARARADLATMLAFAGHDWVEEAGRDAWRITEAGRARHRRQSADQDQFRAQHQLHGRRDVEMPGGAVRQARANAGESPLEWLRGRKDRDGARYLSQEQYEAGERLRRDFTAASIAASVTLDWDRLHRPRSRQRGHPPPAAAGITDVAIAARQRIDAALEAVGPELSGLLVDVCCLLAGLDEVERARRWPRRSAKIVLRLALGQLARHYGMGASDTAARPRARHWGQPGYRPTISDETSGNAA